MNVCFSCILTVYYFQQTNGTLQLIVSKTGLGDIQAVITGDNGDTSIPIAKRIKTDMDAGINTD